MTDKFNLLQHIPAELPEECFDDLLKGKDFRLERIVSRGHASPPHFWYEQDEHEWVLLIRGAAVLHFEKENRRVELRPGDHINIPAHCRHRVDSTVANENTVWLAIFYRD